MTSSRSSTRTKTHARGKTKASAITPTQASFLDRLSVTEKGRRGRRLNEDQRDTLLAYLLFKRDERALDVSRLIPAGSFIARVARHFRETDISYAMPVFQIIMLAASHLTQAGAFVDIRGVGRIVPTLWTIGLAESGSSKTLATDRMIQVLSAPETPPVRMLPSPGSDAQWILDLAENNGAFWFQDEAGKFLNAVLRDSRFARIKPWMLNAYSHQSISNRLKSEASKLVIENPHFTFLGLSVFSSWKTDIDAGSMLDGFCQRFNYFIAPRRTDTTMFNHFLYFSEHWVEKAEAGLRESWRALCVQPGASGAYTLAPGVLEHLEMWWKDLGGRWAGGAVPASFVRRVGFSVVKYLVVIHFLLAKSSRPIDLETAIIATRFAEFHLESAQVMLETYDNESAGKVQKLAAIRDRLIAEGIEPTRRNITRRMSSALRKSMPADITSAICDLLEKVKIKGASEFLGEPSSGGIRAKSSALISTIDEIEKRFALTERKRNERRLRNLQAMYRAGSSPTAPVVIATAPAETEIIVAESAVVPPPAPAPTRPGSLRLVHPVAHKEEDGFAVDWNTGEDFGDAASRLH